MYCYKCGEENPDKAKFCKNCGALLKKEETVNKAEVIEEPIIHQQKTYQNTQQTTTSTSSDNNKGSSWLGCCLCLIAIFIVFAIFGSL